MSERRLWPQTRSLLDLMSQLDPDCLQPPSFTPQSTELEQVSYIKDLYIQIFSSLQIDSPADQALFLGQYLEFVYSFGLTPAADCLRRLEKGQSAIDIPAQSVLEQPPDQWTRAQKQAVFQDLLLPAPVPLESLNSTDFSHFSALFHSFALFLQLAGTSLTQGDNQKTRSTEFIRQNHQAHQQTVNSLLRIGASHGVEPALKYYHYLYHTSGIAEIVQQIPTTCARHFQPGVYAEALAGLYLQQLGYQLTLPNPDQERQAIDFFAQQNGTEYIIQVKGVSSCRQLTAYNLSSAFDRQQLISWTNTQRSPQRLYSNYRHFLRSARQQPDKIPVWIVAPSNSLTTWQNLQSGISPFPQQPLI